MSRMRPEVEIKRKDPLGLKIERQNNYRNQEMESDGVRFIGILLTISYMQKRTPFNLYK